MQTPISVHYHNALKKGPSPVGEAVIATDSYWAYHYALNVHKYAKNVLNAGNAPSGFFLYHRGILKKHPAPPKPPKKSPPQRKNKRA